MKDEELIIEECGTQDLAGIFGNAQIAAAGFGCGKGCSNPWGVFCGDNCKDC